MRPLRLEIQGFSAFRERVEVDFAGADFFALVGPTGAGKSSVIDAMTFALYGSIPRLDKGKVAPVITQGALEARVRFDFGVGADTYTAVRVVRRTPQGATTKEARLERDGDVIAGDADSLTAEVERLLGLPYDQFCRCVVLPQGEFARFLHDTPAHRQDLLVALLDLGMYERMGQRAREVAEFDSGRAVQLAERLETLSFAAEPDALSQAAARVETIERVLHRVDEAQPELERLALETARAREEAAATDARAKTLGAIRVPGHVAELAGAAHGAEAARAAHAASVVAAESAAAAARATRTALPERAPLDRVREAHAHLGGIELKLAEAAGVAGTAVAAETKTAAERAAAEELLRSTEDALEHAKIEHRAHDLAGTLAAGEPCPVCRQTIATVPVLKAPADLRKADRARDQARKAFDRAEAAARKAAEARARADASARQLDGQRDELRARVRSHPDPEDLEALIARIEAADGAVESAAAAEREARAKLAGADGLLEKARVRLAESQRDFDRARDEVADLSPPPPERADLAADWASLASWATQQAAAQREASAAARAKAEEAAVGRTTLVAALERLCADAEIDLGGDPPRDAVIKARENALRWREQVELAREEIAGIADELARLREEEQVSRSLAGHLRANRFEKWVLDEALETLLDGATELLGELSGEQYSLSLDRHGHFMVIDHRNADEVRSARTLSGGETFLASLALALALADRIAQLAARSAVRLESVFLDEGFGTLDPETLDTVGAAIENLAAGSRMVGIVTHVRDLAEKVPVRFEVRKGPHTSVVERVER